MRKNIMLLCAGTITALSIFAQSSKEQKTRIGLKAGYNFSNVIASESGFDPKHNDGYMVSVFLACGNKNGIGYRSELVYSKQGYSFDDGGKNTEVKNDYLYMPHLMTFTFANVVQIQVGGQVGILLNAKASGSMDTAITSLMNRFDYGFAGGFELYPFKGLIIGSRYNLGLGKMYKQYDPSSSANYPLPFDPSKVNLKNSTLQFFVGYRF
jgi:outer membrane protein with beta-barrel domain